MSDETVKVFTSPSVGDPASGRPFYRIFVLHHTHWDREWWDTFQHLRFRLVETLDTLLDTLDTDDEFRNFLLDGQTIVLRDYLEIRPENEEKLAGYIRAGRIQCGPWYILPDEYLVSGEAHIRNIWLGKRLARDLQCPLQNIGYIPDTFGHVAQMPQILRGFSIDNAFVWRGYGGDPDTVKQEFLWESPDGSTVLSHWFPDGYPQMPFLHFDDPDRPYEDKLGRIHHSIDYLGTRATTDILLMPYGGDHEPIDRHLARKIRMANEEIKELGEVRWATAEEYIAAIRERNPRLATVRGELRMFGPDHPNILPGVLSARLYLKQLNFSGQTWLERYAEPLSALAWVRGQKYEAGFLWKAWEFLVQNHPHDSICGCSIDQVHREMVSRFDQSRQIARVLTEGSVQYLNSRLDTSDMRDGDRALVVHNTLPWERSGWASVWVERAEIDPHTHILLDLAGNEVSFQVRDVEEQLPMAYKWRYTEIGFIACNVPGMGYHTFRLTRRAVPLDPKKLVYTAVQSTAMLKGSQALTDLSIGDNVLENRLLKVRVDARDGTLTVTDKTSGQMFVGLNAFEDGGDAGDAYNYSAPLNDMVLRSTHGARVHVSVAAAGYARVTLRLDLDWALPAEISADRASRSSTYLDTRISTFITLDSDSHRVDVITEWVNRSKDHRLRALFPLGVNPAYSCAQGHFEVARRPTASSSMGRGWLEPAVLSMPQQGWVSVSDGERGLLIANRGLPEFEVLRDGDGTIALTILRSVGWLSRDDLLTRVDGAGPTMPAPEAQCLGLNRVQYSIFPLGGDWLRSRGYLDAEEYLVPLYGSATGVHTGDVNRTNGLIELCGEHTLVMSACKKAELDDALVLRFWNVAGEETETHVRLGRLPIRVRLVNLKEEPVEDSIIPVDEDGSFLLRAGPAKIVTVMVWF